MPRARALVAAVPQRVWTAVAGLVLLASLGVTLVLAAGLATWQGAVGNTPRDGRAQTPPGSVVTPPRSAVIVVPTPHAHVPVPAAPPHPSAVHPGVVTVALPPASLPVPAPASAPVAVPPTSAPLPSPPVATPRLTHGTGDASKGKTVKVRHAQKAKHGNHGKHLGWFKNKHGKHS